MNSTTPSRYIHVFISNTPHLGETLCMQFAPGVTASEITKTFAKVASPSPNPATLPPALQQSAANFPPQLAPKVEQILSRTMGHTVAIVLTPTAGEPSQTNPPTPISALLTDSLWPYFGERGSLEIQNQTRPGMPQNLAKNAQRFAQCLLELANGTRSSAITQEMALRQVDQMVNAGLSSIRLTGQLAQQKRKQN